MLKFGERFALTTLSAAMAGPDWNAAHWLAAGAVAAFLFLFEVISIFSYDALRAPNVGLAVQCSLMFVFYGLWMAAPRAIWAIVKAGRRRSATIEKIIAVLALAGLALSAAHLFVLALVLRIFHAPPGWGPAALAKSFGEVWLMHGPLWMIVYCCAAAIIMWLTTGRKTVLSAAPARYEFRDNGKIYSVPFDEIYWVKAAGNYTEFQTANGVRTLRKSLSQVYDELADAGFIKAHRSALVNASHVRAIIPDTQSASFVLDLGNGVCAPLSRRNASAFRALLKSAASQPAAINK